MHLTSFLKFSFTFLITHILIFTSAAQESEPRESVYSVHYICPPCGCPHDGKIFEAAGICPSCNMNLRPQCAGLIGKPVRQYPRVKVAVVLFDGADIMDVTGPMSVFEHAGFNVFLVAKNLEPKRIGLYAELSPDYTLTSLPSVDVIVVPGGGPAEQDQDPDLVAWLQERSRSTDTMFSVCSGAFFLGMAGVLDGYESTTFASLIPNLKSQFPKSRVLNNVKYTDNDKVFTSSGLSSGIDASFAVVAKYRGVGRAQNLANHMEYPWKRQHDYARTQLADNYLVAFNELIDLFSISFSQSEGDMNSWMYTYELWEDIDLEGFMALLKEEIEKMDAMRIIKFAEDKIKTTYDHPILGEGKVEFELKKITKDRIQLCLRAERLKKLSLSAASK